MGSTVLLFLEDTLPEIKKLIDLGIYEQSEAQKIIKKRENFEYAIRAHSKKPIDYLKYIDFEVDVWIEKKLRLIKKFPTEKNFDWDNGLKNAFRIWDLLIKKWPADPNLWIKYCKFCATSKSNHKLSDIVSKFLKRHPTNPISWKFAAKVEFKHRANPSLARNIFLKGISFCNHSKEFWISFLKFEFDYLNFSIFLKENNTDLKTIQKQLKTISTIDFEKKEENEESDFLPFEMDTSSLPQDGPFWSGALFKVVFKKAIESVKDLREFKKDILLILTGREKKQKIHEKMKLISEDLENFVLENFQEKNFIDEESFSEKSFLLKLNNTDFQEILQIGKEWSEKFNKNVEDIWNSIFVFLNERNLSKSFLVEQARNLREFRIFFITKLIHDVQTFKDIYPLLQKQLLKFTEKEFKHFIQLFEKFEFPSDIKQKIFEKATSEFPQNCEFWAKFCLFLVFQKKLQESGLLYHKAVSILKNPNEFIRLYNQGVNQ